MVIAHNISAINTQRQLNVTTKKQAKSTEKLSSGYRINRAADDAAGLSISEKMRRLIRGLDRGADNITEGISLVQTADGALGEVIDNLQRIRQLSIAAYNGTNSESDIAAMQAEVDQSLTEIGRIGETTTFNGKALFQGAKTVYVGRTPDMIETYDEVTYATRRVPNWITQNSDMEMKFENPRTKDCVPGNDDGIMYTTESGPDGKSTIVYYGKEIQPPETPMNQAEHRGDWGPKLDDNASAVLDFSALKDCDKPEDLFDHMVDLLGVSIKYPCGNCHDSRCGIHFIGEVEGMPFTLPDSSKVTNGSDQVGTVNLSDQVFPYNITRNGSSTSYSANGYFQAIENLKEQHNDPALALTDEQKKQETKELADQIARDLTTKSLTALQSASQGHYDRVIRNQPDGNYSLIIYDYRDKGKLLYPDQATSQTISSAEGYMELHNEKTRIKEGEDLYALEGITIVPSTEYAKSIELTLPKITLKELEIENYRLGTQYDTHVDYKYGERAQKKLAEAQIQYAKDKEAYDKALATVLASRATLGAQQNRLEHAYKINKNTEENEQAAESKIRDTDMSREVVENSKASILAQAGQAMLAQANQQPQSVLQLLQ